jgi:SM-20-related protein
VIFSLILLAISPNSSWDFMFIFLIFTEGSFKNSKNRVVTTVYYLNENWSEDDGGELVIYDEDNNYLTKVTPHANTLIVFLSDKFPHEVLPAKKKRFSIAGWFRVDK